MAIVSCPECNKKLKVADTSVGKKVKCSCGNIFVAQVDAPVEAAPAAAAPAEKVYVACTECGAKLKVPTTSLGKKMKCPKCAGVFVAQLEEQTPPPPPPEPDPELADDEEMPPPMAKPIKKAIADDDDLAAFAAAEEDEEMPRPKAKGKPKMFEDDEEEMPRPKGKPGKQPPKMKEGAGDKPVYPSRILQTLLVTLMLLGLAGVFVVMFFGPDLFDLDIAKLAHIKSAEGLKKIHAPKHLDVIPEKDKGARDKTTNKKTDDGKPADKDGKNDDKGTDDKKEIGKDKNGDKKDDDGKIDDKKGAGPVDIEGRWSVLSAVVKGKEDAGKVGDAMIFEKGKATLGGAPAAYALNNSSSPMSIDFTMQTGPDTFIKVPAIYKIEGDKLYLGLPADPKSAQRPKDFAGKDGMAVVLRRAAKGENVYSRVGSANNLKMIGLALHAYHDANKSFPPAGSADKNGKPLLSWRVAILPFIDQQELYNQFDLTKPWDDPHNLKLVGKMPKTYMVPGVESKEGMTHYRTLVGPGTALEPLKSPENKIIARTMLAMVDGTSNVIVALEAKEATIWTRPDDLSYDPKGPLPQFGVTPAGFNACFGDGTVRFVDAKTPENVLRPYLTCNNGTPRQPLEKE